MKVLLGFDPGGDGQFGWCMSYDRDQLPLQVRETGTASNAQSAVTAALMCIGEADEVAAVGIDAPLFWVADGDRIVDRVVRTAIRQAGCTTSAGTCQHVNSLRGACLIQGILTGLMIRERYPNVLITESHPKALLWLLGVARRHSAIDEINLADLKNYLQTSGRYSSADERDAALGTMGAWSMLHQPSDWEDLFCRERRPYLPIPEPIAYWMPRF